MPIYAYKCESCGFAKDVLQKMSDTPLTDCPQCGAASFRKQLTAAGFQLKGSGWYVTDFRGGDGAAGAKTPDSAAGGSGTDSKPAESGTPAPGSASSAASVPAAASPAPAVAKASGGDSATKSS
ncbi:MAG: FmdB family zinc ribbon protein [Polaromonas sp.]